MRRLPLIALLISASLALATSVANAEEEEEEQSSEARSWTVQVDPLTTALGIAHVLLERRIADHVAVYVGPNLKLYDSVFGADETYRALGVEMGARWFWSGTAPAGWWTGLRATIAHVSHQNQSRTGGYVSALAGYAWIMDSGLMLSGALGVSYFDYNAGGVGVDGVLPGAHTAIGFAF